MPRIKCNHCNSYNRDTEMHCTQCGAPLELNRTFGYNIELVPPGYVYGIDVSAWNGTMDWNITKNLVHFVKMRAGYGDLGIDNKVNIYRDGIVQTPLVYGLYWYVRVGMDWRKHVNTFKTVWDAGKGVLTPVFDFEYTSLNPADTTNWISSLLQEWAHRTGVAAEIYSSAGWWNSNVLSYWVCINPKWVANWTNALTPTMPRGWAEWLFWQYSADGNRLGRKYGSIDGDADMDLDKYNGNLDKFNSAYKVNLLPLPSEPPEEPVYSGEEIAPRQYVIVNATSLNMRSLPDATSKDIGTLKAGSDIPVLEEYNGWYRTEGWVSGRYCRNK
jgi:GH25 family lysozyme M1 (1,4-beta-N-acetylmuramidase)